MQPFNWTKRGIIFDPTNRFYWMQNFAQVPTILEKENFLRVFFTCRPKRDDIGNSISNISYIDVDKDDPSKILYIHDKPILPLGPRGSFDEFGVHPCCFIENKGIIFFYYQGWTRMASVPYTTALGLAISEDGGNTFYKYGEGPLFARTYNEPYLENGFFVYKENNKFIMFYATCFEWLEIANKPEPIYQIVSATSEDGIHWKRNGKICFEPKFSKEASGRPCVIKIDDIYHMWFCFRNVLDFREGGDGAYNIGYAWSKDLLSWNRDDKMSGISKSETGWDSQMIAYPFVFKNKDNLYLFYNGNEFGKEGFGYATFKIV